jgi:hypothetical protein
MKAIAKKTFSIGQMVNEGREFYVRKGSLGKVKLCNTNSNSTMVAEITRELLNKNFEIVK